MSEREELGNGDLLQHRCRRFIKEATLKRLDCIVGTRPNFVKIAPIIRALLRREGFAVRLVHTGQHYDVALNAVFFDELGIPDPDVNLEVGSGTHTEQTARIMLALESVLTNDRPDMLIVVGDVNSTLAATLVASKMLIPVAHVEAGLRSNDRAMPEEVNRIVTDSLCDLLLTTERSASDNLLREGARPERIGFVGNVMIDTLHACLERAVPAGRTFDEIGAGVVASRAEKSGYGFVTLHRPSNVDDEAQLRGLIEALCEITHAIPLLFAVHPRTRAKMEAAGLGRLFEDGRLLATPPLSYLRSLGLMREARLVITDSGGIQEETTALGVPCLTVRDNTERPITIAEGTNTLVGTSPAALKEAAADVLVNGGKCGRVPELWDGNAAERIVDHVRTFLAFR
ncbi:non-hydrolyzing UDP-N-acetylglucosamine 2-epimerase [Methylosinus sp. PW1]|uniref:non-hydrolyzing UDP-N-acetylglucosamine 2-epimerase n=1 Tax=Methylosinus sp. PW1 TaxID=107636 RepID=UPI000ADAFC9D|nr:UDP-N-acetylglucosamine 2-epimerase (non-hydrolyzing) [Methylosinus sp. PW1]